MSRIIGLFDPAPRVPRPPAGEAARRYPIYRMRVLEATFVGYAAFCLVRNNLSLHAARRHGDRDRADGVHLETHAAGTRIRMRTILVAIPLGCALMCTSCTNDASSGSARRITVIAHRGDSSNAPENTLAAFRSALAAKADYVELDARPSADGTLYCLHDETLDRTTDAVSLLERKKIRIREVRDADLARLDAGAWFKPQFAGERLPTLAAALDLIQAESRTLLEHKDGPADAYVRLLRDKRLIGKLIVQSFDWGFLADLHRLEPRQPLAALGDKTFDEQRWARLARTGAKLVAWKHTDLTADLVAELRRRGYGVFAWTADEPHEWQRLAGFGIDGIITNRPAALITWLAAR